MKNLETCLKIKTGLETIKIILKKIIAKAIHPWLLFYSQEIKTKINNEIKNAIETCQLKCLQCPNCLDFSMIFKEFERFVEFARGELDKFDNLLSSQKISNDEKVQILRAYQLIKEML